MPIHTSIKPSSSVMSTQAKSDAKIYNDYYFNFCWCKYPNNHQITMQKHITECQRFFKSTAEQNDKESLWTCTKHTIQTALHDIPLCWRQSLWHHDFLFLPHRWSCSAMVSYVLKVGWKLIISPDWLKKTLASQYTGSHSGIYSSSPFWKRH